MAELWGLIQSAGVPGALFVFIWLGMSGRVTWGRELTRCEEIAETRLREMRTERDKWRDLALENTTLAGKLANRVPPATEVS